MCEWVRIVGRLFLHAFGRTRQNDVTPSYFFFPHSQLQDHHVYGKCSKRREIFPLIYFLNRRRNYNCLFRNGALTIDLEWMEDSVSINHTYSCGSEHASLTVPSVVLSVDNNDRFATKIAWKSKLLLCKYHVRLHSERDEREEKPIIFSSNFPLKFPWLQPPSVCSSCICHECRDKSLEELSLMSTTNRISSAALSSLHLFLPHFPIPA